MWVMKHFFKKSVLSCAVVMAATAGAAEIYIGGGDTPDGTWGAYLADTTQWRFVRANADGYYLNLFDFIENLGDKNPNDPARFRNRDDAMRGMHAAFKNKNLFYETEAYSYMERVWDNDDRVVIQKLLDIGFDVKWTTVNGSFDQARVDALQQGASGHRPVLAMWGAWVIGGNIESDAGDAIRWRGAFDLGDGLATDGPVGLWNTNSGDIKGGQFSAVRYARNHGKVSMLMLCPFMPNEYDNGLLATDGTEFLRIGKIEVWEHENNYASPDIWVVSYYASQLQTHPVLPESVNGEAAPSMTGMAYWLIHHVKDTDNDIALTVDAAENIRVADDSVNVVTRNGSATVTLRMSNGSSWLDFAPFLKAIKRNHGDSWNISYTYDGENVTEDLGGAGLDCVDGVDRPTGFRLNPQTTRTIAITFTPAENAEPLDLDFEEYSHSTEKSPKRTLHFHVAPEKDSTDKSGQGSTAGNEPETAFYGTPVQFPGTLQAEAYNNGGPNVGYSDNSAGNYGDSRLRDDDVDIAHRTVNGELSDFVGWTEAGEWLKYSISIAEDAAYDITFCTSAANNGGRLQLSWNDQAYSPEIEIPATASWDEWSTKTIRMDLHAGDYSMKLHWVTSDVNIDWIEFRKAEETARFSKPITFQHKSQEPYRARLYDLHGNIVKTFSSRPGSKDFEGTPAGVYMMREKTGSSMESRRIQVR